MRETAQPKRGARADEHKPDEQDHSWPDLVDRLLEDQFAEFRHEARQPSWQPRLAQPRPAWLTPPNHR